MSESPYGGVNLLSKKEVARILGCAIRTVERLAVTGKLPFYRIPCATGHKTRMRFDSGEIAAWVKAMTPQGGDNGHHDC